MKKNTIIWIVVILLVLGLIYWAYTKNKLSFLGINKVVSGTGDESHCNDNGNERSSARDGEVCLPPVTDPLYLVVGNVKERSFTEKSLGFNPDPNLKSVRGEGVKIKLPGDPNTWYFNQTRLGNNPENAKILNDPKYYDAKFPVTQNKFLFVNNISNPNPAVS